MKNVFESCGSSLFASLDYPIPGFFVVNYFDDTFFPGIHFTFEGFLNLIWAEWVALDAGATVGGLDSGFITESNFLGGQDACTTNLLSNRLYLSDLIVDEGSDGEFGLVHEHSIAYSRHIRANIHDKYLSLINKLLCQSVALAKDGGIL